MTDNLSILAEAGFITKTNPRVTAEKIDPETGEIQRHNKTELRIKLYGDTDALLAQMSIAHRPKKSKKALKLAPKARRCAAHPHAVLHVTEMEMVACTECQRFVDERVTKAYLRPANVVVLEGDDTTPKSASKNYPAKNNHVIEEMEGTSFSPTPPVSAIQNGCTTHEVGTGPSHNLRKTRDEIRPMPEIQTREHCCSLQMEAPSPSRTNLPDTDEA